MGLTEKVRLLLESKGFKRLYEDHVAVWVGLAEDAKMLMAEQIPGRSPTVDDIKLLLLPILELNDHFRKFMADHLKLTQQFWSSHFSDYVLDRVYEPSLKNPEENAQ